MAIVALAFVIHSVFPNAHQFVGLGGAGAADGGATAEGDQNADESGKANVFAIVRNLQLPAPMRDPFAIRVKAAVETAVEKVAVPDAVESVHLSAVWTQGGKTLVLINDRICENGDEIGRIKIDAVTREGVWLSHWKGRDFVRVGGSFTLNTPVAKNQRVASSL